jgi:predicted enzyme related to lactoylglutathione lyase
VILYMVELIVSEFDAAVRWFRDVLGLRVLLIDELNRFALLQGVGGGRLALKAGNPAPGGLRLHFQVPDLDIELKQLEARGGHVESPPLVSPEGYRRAIVRGPAGYPIVLFEWVKPGSFAT